MSVPIMAVKFDVSCFIEWWFSFLDVSGTTAQNEKGSTDADGRIMDTQKDGEVGVHCLCHLLGRVCV